MNEANLIPTIIQGGAVGISILLIWVVYKLVNNHDAHMMDALNRNTDAWVENAKAMAALTQKLNK